MVYIHAQQVHWLINSDHIPTDNNDAMLTFYLYLTFANFEIACQMGKRLQELHMMCICSCAMPFVKLRG